VRTSAQQNGALAFKVHWDQVEWCKDQLTMNPLDAVGHRQDVKYVRVRREDLVAQTISSFIASATKVFAVRTGDPIRPNDEFDDVECSIPEYDFRELVRVLNHLAAAEFAWSPYFDDNGIVPYELTYEELDRDLNSAVNGVLNFLGLDENCSIAAPLTKLRTEVNRVHAERFRRDLRDSGMLELLPSAIRERCMVGENGVS
jgi:LPS sulfotransferase NodH